VVVEQEHLDRLIAVAVVDWRVHRSLPGSKFTTYATYPGSPPTRTAALGYRD
jgi:hypothetical protein